MTYTIGTTLQFPLRLYDTRWDTAVESQATKANEWDACQKLFLLGMCLSGPLRMPTTKFFTQAGQMAADGKILGHCLLPGLALPVVSVPLTKVTVGKRQPLTTVPIRESNSILENVDCHMYNRD